MLNRKHKTEYIVTGALIAAAYVGLTFLSNAFGLAYGPIQLRVSEVLTLLPIFTPAAIPGVTVGCFIANIASFNLLDMIFGTAATLLAACVTYLFRNLKLKGLPVLAILSPVIINSLIIGLEISFFYLSEADSLFGTLGGFLISVLQVGIGEAIVCLGFGIPFYLIIERCNIFKVEV